VSSLVPRCWRRGILGRVSGLQSMSALGFGSEQTPALLARWIR
jgi:hypothetical protein